jgi:hypothetical protein
VGPALQSYACGLTESACSRLQGVSITEGTIPDSITFRLWELAKNTGMQQRAVRVLNEVCHRILSSTILLTLMNALRSGNFS